MHLIHLPQLGYTMETGTITAWLVREGESFRAGDRLYEVETEKNAVEVEARLPGTVTRIVAPLNEELQVGTLLAVVADDGEQPEPAAVDRLVETQRAGSPAEPLAAETVEPDRASRGERVRALPKVKAFAAEHGVDLAAVTGSGPRGSILLEDVQAVLAGGPAVREKRRLGQVRRASAGNVTRSWNEIPQFVQQFRVDLGAVHRYQEQRRQAGQPVGMTAVLVAALAHAVREVPEVNATYLADEVTLYSDVNVAIAVASERGLLVPVLPQAQRKTVGEIAVQVRELVERARSGSARSEAEPTITLSNLGQTPVEKGTALITAGQAVIMFAGATVDTPVVRDGSVVIRPMLGLSVAYDHRIVDGATGAAFCTALVAALSAPESLERPPMTS